MHNKKTINWRRYQRKKKKTQKQNSIFDSTVCVDTQCCRFVVVQISKLNNTIIYGGKSDWILIWESQTIYIFCRFRIDLRVKKKKNLIVLFRSNSKFRVFHK